MNEIKDRKEFFRIYHVVVALHLSLQLLSLRNSLDESSKAFSIFLLTL